MDVSKAAVVGALMVSTASLFGCRGADSVELTCEIKEESHTTPGLSRIGSSYRLRVDSGVVLFARGQGHPELPTCFPKPEDLPPEYRCNSDYAVSDREISLTFEITRDDYVQSEVIVVDRYTGTFFVKKENLYLTPSILDEGKDPLPAFVERGKCEVLSKKF